MLTKILAVHGSNCLISVQIVVGQCVCYFNAELHMLTLEQSMKSKQGVEVYLYSFFNLGARGGCMP
jgi:hypothetical protein